MARALVTSCSIAAPIVFAVSAVAIHAAGESWLRAGLFSVFIAFWGGLGFGCMIGAVVWATRLEAAAAEAPAAIGPATRTSRTTRRSEPAGPIVVDTRGQATRAAGAELLGPAR